MARRQQLTNRAESERGLGPGHLPLLSSIRLGVSRTTLAGCVRMTVNESIPELRYGNRVSSPTMGEGIVVGTLDNGLVRVCFDRDKIERDWNPTDLGFVPSSTTLSPSRGEINPAVAWNVAVIAVGTLIAFIGLIVGLSADPENSALRQTVKALWIIQGLIGLLIAAIGILGATISTMLHKDRRS
jgi:hypothetical protein